MGQSKPLRSTALVVEDDPMQRERMCVLLEESDLAGIEKDVMREVEEAVGVAIAASFPSVSTLETDVYARY